MSDYVRINSSDGFSFVVKREIAIASGTLMMSLDPDGGHPYAARRTARATSSAWSAAAIACQLSLHDVKALRYELTHSLDLNAAAFKESAENTCTIEYRFALFSFDLRCLRGSDADQLLISMQRVSSRTFSCSRAIFSCLGEGHRARGLMAALTSFVFSQRRRCKGS